MKSRHAIVAAATAGVFSLGTATVALATADVEASRLAGSNRYVTSQVIADDTFGDVTVAIVTSGENFPDALAANYLAGASSAPVILTQADQLTSAAEQALEAVQADGVLVVGGTDAVSEDVFDALATAGYNPQRVAGGDRYATARAVAESVPEEQIGSLQADIGRTALLASGENFPDALAAGPLAYQSAFPLLLTPTTVLSEQAETAITNLDIEQVLILGGEVAISAEVEAAVAGMGVEVRRVAGNDRTLTAAAVADLAVAELDFATNHVNLARSDEFADALSGGPHAGEELGPILLTTSPDTLGTAAQSWLEAHSETLTTIDVYGGPAAVSDATVDAAEVAAGRTP